MNAYFNTLGSCLPELFPLHLPRAYPLDLPHLCSLRAGKNTISVQLIFNKVSILYFGGVHSPSPTIVEQWEQKRDTCYQFKAITYAQKKGLGTLDVLFLCFFPIIQTQAKNVKEELTKIFVLLLSHHQEGQLVRCHGCRRAW